MDVVAVSKLLHILSAMTLVTGLVGRWIANTRAARSEITAMETLLGVSVPFERMTIGGSLAVLVTGLLTAWLARLPVLGFLEGASINWILLSLALFLAVMGLVPPLVFLPAGRAFAAAREAARRAGTVTPELRQAFASGRVRAAHILEFVLVFVVLALMVLKPF